MEQISEGSNREVLPDLLKLDLAQYQQLRYGENPHQAAVWYSDGRFGGNQIESFPPFEQLQGKELSSNNITDTYCLVNILRDIGTPAACIIKHNNPCGVAVGKTLEEAYDKAHSTDPEAAFGGIFGFTETVDDALAKKITEGFVEIVAAPDFSFEALEVFKKKKNVRVLKLKNAILKAAATTSWHLRDLQDFGWIIEKDVEPPVQLAQFQRVSGEALGGEHIADAAFAWAVVKHLTSNAIFIARDGKSLGFGIGQTSRIASVKIALAQAGESARGAVMASDAFFPAIDNIEAAAKAGIEVIIQPGGSIKDKDVIEACDKNGIKMLFTGQRVFKH
jgi:phosphoribosylaminoimidazolecarboxamide formyltransferase / IMP cyclohydrolase